MITRTHTKQPSLSGVALTSAQSPEEQVIKEPVSSERTSEDSENASELILPKVSCSSDKSMISKKEEQLSKYIQISVKSFFVSGVNSLINL